MMVTQDMPSKRNVQGSNLNPHDQLNRVIEENLRCVQQMLLQSATSRHDAEVALRKLWGSLRCKEKEFLTAKSQIESLNGIVASLQKENAKLQENLKSSEEKKKAIERHVERHVAQLTKKLAS
ncbi:hypothetical protein PIB30_009308 [Stylosanthes scabra]|uniref:Uncharacterized protein n=1 Tax=Stylosanthes scabra TaxID=79078 RepID=A0ABU6T798_9FABA|nr:hypothetical protein [Stylosanthes scabra]